MTKKGGISKLIEEEHKIEFIILRKFPLYKYVKYGERQPPGSLSNGVVDKKLRKEILGYEKEILSLDRPSFEKLYSQILEETNQEREQSYFFNQPDAQADVDYWARLSSWKAEEAVALSFGKNPKVVTLKNIVQNGVKDSNFGNEFLGVLEIVTRAVEDGVLDKKLKPSVFLAWAKDLKISVPDGLIEAVNKFNKPSPPESKEGSTRLQVPESQRQNEFTKVLTDTVNEFIELNSYLPNTQEVIRRLKNSPPDGEIVEFTSKGIQINNSKEVVMENVKRRIVNVLKSCEKK